MSDQILSPAAVLTLPNEYVQLEYIESDGSQYINTEIIGKDNLNITLKFQALNFSSYGGIFGNYVSETYNCWRLLFTNKDNNRFYTNPNTVASAVTTVTMERQAINTFSLSQERVLVNDQLIQSINQGAGTGNSSNILLFTQNGSACIAMRLYYFEVYDGEVLLKRFIPAKRLQDETVGLYEIIDGRFYTNARTGNFLPGSEIVPVIPKKRGNVIKPRHGQTEPTIEDLEEYELGYCGGALYIRENDAIVKISGGGGGSAGDIYVDQDELEEMLNGVFGQ